MGLVVATGAVERRPIDFVSPLVTTPASRSRAREHQEPDSITAKKLQRFGANGHEKFFVL